MVRPAPGPEQEVALLHPVQVSSTSCENTHKGVWRSCCIQCCDAGPCRVTAAVKAKAEVS